MSSPQVAMVCLVLASLLQLPFSSCMPHLPHLTEDPEEAHKIAEEAYIFFYPAVVNWRFLAFATEVPSRLRLNPFDRFEHNEETEFPNDNVIYSQAWLDLRQEPRVISMPKIRGRYWSVLFIDGYTHNIGIASQRTVKIDNRGGLLSVIVAGPSTCSSPLPCSLDHEKQFCSEGDFALVIVRIQFDSDKDTISDIQDLQFQFRIGKLSESCGIVGPDPYPVPVPFRITGTPVTLEFFDYANRIMKNLTIHATEQSLFQRFARIGVVPGEDFPPPGLQQDVLKAIERGIDMGDRLISSEILNPPTGDQRQGWQVVINPPQFGTREVMQGRYLTRAAAARSGLYGLDPEEAYYPSARVTAFGLPLNGEENEAYYIHFTLDQLPPVFVANSTELGLLGDGYWSITMHNSPTGSFVENPINRHSLGLRELDTLCRYNDQSFVIVIQRDEPTDPGFRRNWLPAPDGRFFLLARLYLPLEEAIEEPYLPPGIRHGLPRRSPTNCPPLI